MAVGARDEHGAGQVAGSLGPMGFSYRPDLAPPAEEAAEVYSRVCKAMQPLVDVYVCETMCSVDQARGALMGATGHGRPVWLSLSVDDNDGTKLRSGEPLSEVFPLLCQYNPAAVLLNCSVPEAITQSIPILAQNEQKIPCGAYANGFSKISSEFDAYGATVDCLESRKDLGPEAYADFATDWVDNGAMIVGGCCEVGPEHIKLLAETFA